MPQAQDRPFILNASLFHNSSQHLDEVEIVIDSVVVRVTPTSLKDCAKGLRRFLELVELTTKEMERKVHEEGRIARRMELLGKCKLRLLSIWLKLYLTTCLGGIVVNRTKS
jgi:hypothetical protein